MAFVAFLVEFLELKHHSDGRHIDSIPPLIDYVGFNQ